MTMNANTLPGLVVTGALLASPLVAAASAASDPAREVRAIEVWTRSAGATGDDEPAQVTAIPITSFRLRTFERNDVQYDKKLVFRGFPLAEVIDRAKPPAGTDLALLHFSNGMAIPLPFRDAAAMKRLDPILAVGVVTGGKPSPLPVVTRKAREYVDIPSIAFDGNKVVVADSWHPMLAPDTKGWSPWRNASSLAAVEFVTAEPYYAQFDVGTTPLARAGLTLFKENCQFCHGARKVGAKLGWDFVEPMPLYTWRGSSHQLYMHIAFRRLDAPERNQMMPALKHMSEDDAIKLWKWLEAIGTSPMRPYAPVAAAPTGSPAPAAAKK
jgi:mono/diheme cytochrome c family protein